MIFVASMKISSLKLSKYLCVAILLQICMHRGQPIHKILSQKLFFVGKFRQHFSPQKFGLYGGDFHACISTYSGRELNVINSGVIVLIITMDQTEKQNLWTINRPKWSQYL